ncbi:LD-carboxypeptidase [Bacillus sp. 1780r2a1]|nr:LD-carboxypeptidase [Bacillus sp. 1780r2a1]
MIQFPRLKHTVTIGVTAPSSGIPEALHHMFRSTCDKMEERGYKIQCHQTVWTQMKAKSASAKVRARELMSLLEDSAVDLIIPPWGGELLIEILEHLPFQEIKPKWVLGYSDTSLFLLALTLQTGIATAHGPNLVDLRGEYWDETTKMWERVLKLEEGKSITQYSSTNFQKEWQHNNPSPCVFHLTEPTEWKTVGNKEVVIEGRLLGGCIDVIRHVVGTPFGNVKRFQQKFIHGGKLIWYFENCELSATDLRRTLVQMKLAGWFNYCSGILFGRSAANHPVGGYTGEDVYEDLFKEHEVPIAYDLDFGHMPPQLTLVNGAFAKVEIKNGKGYIKQTFKN